MSVPIELTAHSDGSVGLAPVPELKRLRQAHWHYANLEVGPGASGRLGEIGGDCLELEVEFEAEAGATFGLRLRCSPDGAEQTRVLYVSSEQRLIVDPSGSSLSTVVDRDIHKAPLSPDEQGRLRLHIFLDRSVLEVFANGRTCLASRIYPTRPDSVGVDLFASSGQARVVSLDIWTLGSIWR